MRILTKFGTDPEHRKRMFDSLSDDERRAIEAEWQQLPFEERAQAIFDITPKRDPNARFLPYRMLPADELKKLHKFFRTAEMRRINPLGSYIYDAVMLKKQYNIK